MLVDAHTHIEQKDLLVFQTMLKDKKLEAIVSSRTKEEYQYHKEFLKKEWVEGQVKFSFGIHPWDAGKVEVEELLHIFKEADIIGEIGMDSYWTENPLGIQEKYFIKQLELAEHLQKPVVLHTKGQEKKIAEIIKLFKGRKLVHWYDCPLYVEDYIKEDCFFSINLDCEKNNNAKTLIKKVPIERLLLETDGIISIKWLLENQLKDDIKELSFDTSLMLMKNTLKSIAEIKNISVEKCENQMYENYSLFIGKK